MAGTEVAGREGEHEAVKRTAKDAVKVIGELTHSILTANTMFIEAASKLEAESILTESTPSSARSANQEDAAVHHLLSAAENAHEVLLKCHSTENAITEQDILLYPELYLEQVQGVQTAVSGLLQIHDATKEG